MKNSAIYGAKEAWLQSRNFSQTVDGEGYAAGHYSEVIGPATGQRIAVAPLVSSDGVNDAVGAAHAAFLVWRNVGFEERRQTLLRFADLIGDHAEELADILTLENGRPYVQCLGEIKRQRNVIETLTSIRIDDEIVRDDERSLAKLIYKPLGVVAAIAPWNVPVTMAIGKACHALYTGNTIVLKPSPYTPLTTLRIGELSRSIFPAGVFNVISGGNEVGKMLAEHPRVAKVTFTGSGPTGSKVIHSSAADFKRTTLELGGNDAGIVMPDADLTDVARRIFAASFANSGQICMAIKRLYVHTSILDDLASALAFYAKTAVVGDGFQEGVQLGPVQNRVQLEIVQGMAESVTRDGGRFIAGGQRIDRFGYFFEPSIAVGLSDGSTLVDEEPFGPILPIVSFDDVDEVISRANASRFGLSASIWTADTARAEHIARCLDAGTVWINDHLAPDPLVPMGGVKSSGLGREYGKLGLLHFMEPSAIVTGRQRRDIWFNPEPKY